MLIRYLLLFVFLDETADQEDHALARKLVRTIQHDLDKGAEVAKLTGQVAAMETPSAAASP